MHVFKENDDAFNRHKYIHIHIDIHIHTNSCVYVLKARSSSATCMPHDSVYMYVNPKAYTYICM